ncbi:MAG: hypothetical protein RLZZ164_86 [Actinomycetota bacterium]
MRKTITAIALISLLLTGCAPTSTSYDSQSPLCGPAESNAAADKISATGDFDTKPTVTIAAPISSKTIATKVLSEGTGKKYYGNQLVKFEYTALNATTGATFSSSKYDGTDAITQEFDKGQQIDFCKALGGVREGSRVAVLIPAKMAHKNQGDVTNKIGANDDVVFVLDLLKVYYNKAYGAGWVHQDGAPTLLTAANGQPSVQIPKTAAPTSTKLYLTVKSPETQEVAIGDTVTLQYSGFLWSNGTVFDSSWTSGQPVTWTLSQDGFIKGFVRALTESRDGKAPHVGDQIMAVIPPSEGYGNTEKTGIPAGSTLVFVIDILGTEKPKN